MDDVVEEDVDDDVDDVDDVDDDVEELVDEELDVVVPPQVATMVQVPVGPSCKEVVVHSHPR